MADFFGRRDSLWGGETLHVTEDQDALGLKLGDKFRIEKSQGSFTLIPDSRNPGPWKDSHNKLNPIPITRKKVKPTSFARAYSMTVKTKANLAPRELFLVETAVGSIKISSVAVVPAHHESDHDIAGVER